MKQSAKNQNIQSKKNNIYYNFNYLKIRQNIPYYSELWKFLTFQLYGCGIHHEALKTYINEIYFNKNIQNKYYKLEKENLTN